MEEGGAMFIGADVTHGTNPKEGQGIPSIAAVRTCSKIARCFMVFHFATDLLP